MSPKTARWYLDAWAKGAHISQGIVESAISALVKGAPNPFVEECIRRRKRLDWERAEAELSCADAEEKIWTGVRE